MRPKRRTDRRSARYRGLWKRIKIVEYARAGTDCQACRLLGNSRRPQSVGAIEIHPDAPDPVSAKVVDARVRRIDWSATAFAASLQLAQDKHAIAEIAKLLSDGLELLPVLARVGVEAVGALASPVAAPTETPNQTGARSLSPTSGARCY